MIGIALNPYLTSVPRRLVAAAAELGIPIRIIDLPTLRVEFDVDEGTVVRDAAGVVDIAGLAPYLLSGYPAAVHAVRVLSQRAYVHNPVESVLMADDKAATAVSLSHFSLPQVRSIICPLDLQLVLSAAEKIQYPVVMKRAHGANGRWVRRADEPTSLTKGFRELESRGPGALLVQPQITEFYGRSIRVVVTGQRLLAAELRVAVAGEWRSNIVYGATQHPIDLTSAEGTLAVDAVHAMALSHAGVDILRTTRGPVILEVNSYPDFTKMLPRPGKDLARAVLLACLPP